MADRGEREVVFSYLIVYSVNFRFVSIWFARLHDNYAWAARFINFFRAIASPVVVVYERLRVYFRAFGGIMY